MIMYYSLSMINSFFKVIKIQKDNFTTIIEIYIKKVYTIMYRPILKGVKILPSLYIMGYTRIIKKRLIIIEGTFIITYTL